MKKLSLSKKGKEEVVSFLNKAMQEVNTNEEISFGETRVTSSFLNSVTKISDEAEYINKNEELTKQFQGLISMYGFNNMYDLYMYARSCDDLYSLVKSKDYSKLVPVKRTIMRNGKKQEVTVWEKPGDEEPADSEDSQQEGGSKKRRHARELRTKRFGGKKKTSIKDLSTIKNAAKNLNQGIGSFSENAHTFLSVENEDGVIVGIVGYKTEGNYLFMDFYRTDGSVNGIATVGFMNLLVAAAEQNKGVKVEDMEQARNVFIQSGLHQEEGYWVIEAEELRNIMKFGDGNDTT